MDFYTAVLRKSASYWTALCLENGVVAQGETKKEAIEKCREAISSFELVRREELDIHTAPVSIKELHEFLTFDNTVAVTEPLELRALNA